MMKTQTESPIRAVGVLCALIIHTVVCLGAIVLEDKAMAATAIITIAFLFWTMGVEENNG